MTLSDYQRWLGFARKVSRRDEEAADLLQDALLIAAEAGRLDFSAEEHRKWFAGVLRNRAAMIARGEGRRKERERKEGMKQSREAEGNSAEINEPYAAEATEELLEGLSPAPRRLAALILHGMTREEILFALDLSPTAYRQRLVAIRKYLSERSQEFRVDMLAVAYYRRSGADEPLERGLIRRSLLQSVRIRRDVGGHDPDGHLILFRSL